MKKIVIFFIIVSVLISCSSDENNSSNSTQIDLVTGINLVNNFGISEGKIGNPNELPRDNISISVIVYPNPSTNHVIIKSITKIKSVWVIKGVKTNNYQEIDFLNILKSNLYSAKEILSKSLKEFTEVRNRELILDLSSFNDGFYKVFVQLEDDSISWTNIYKGNVNDINIW